MTTSQKKKKRGGVQEIQIGKKMYQGICTTEIEIVCPDMFTAPLFISQKLNNPDGFNGTMAKHHPCRISFINKK